ncbi:MAG: DUF1549 domain-containing protein [Acidobacteria bacterium]|nr:DUF1549 domain-containing protein [Acidobacteriota bacterium]
MFRVALLAGCVMAAVAQISLAQLAGRPVDFARDVHPIFAARCASCHSGEKAQGGLRLNTAIEVASGGVSGAGVVPGSSKDSLLLRRITGLKLPRMPMGTAPLTPEEIAIVRAWIDQGAKPGAPGGSIARWTPPLAPRRPEVPAGPGRPLERFLAAYSRERGIAPAAAVNDETFLRRAFFDLWGLPPTPAQRTAFMKAPDRARLIDELLAGRTAYAEHWISFWNDLLHNDEGVTYIGDRKSISSWLLKALKSNMPYDRMTRELLDPGPESEGFIRGVNWRGDVSASQVPVMQAAQNSAQVFLGVNLKCNSCHDSFISHWKLKDAYGLASFFSEAPLEIARCDARTGETAVAKFLYPELGGVHTDATLAAKRRAAAYLFTQRGNGRFARTFVNRIWQRLLGRGLVEPIDDMDAESWDSDLLDWLAWDFAENGYDIHHLLRRIMTSRAYQLPADPVEEKAYIFRGPRARRLTAEQFADTVSAVTGEWGVLGSIRAEPGLYAREWQFKASPLTRALGRPMRDMAVTQRTNDPITLQLLELVNGTTLAARISRGARRMLGEMPAAPAPLFDSGVVNAHRIIIDIDITGAHELRLLIEDYDSYDRGRVVAGWMDAILEGPGAAVKLSDLTPRGPARSGSIQLRNDRQRAAIIAPVPSELVYDIAGRGFTRLRTLAGVDRTVLKSDINPRIRFFVFAQAPDRAQMMAVAGEPPVGFEPERFTPDTLITRICALLHTGVRGEPRLRGSADGPRTDRAANSSQRRRPSAGRRRVF